MAKYVTKYFGEIDFDEASNTIDFDVVFNGQEINICFNEVPLYRDKIQLCWDIIDQYDKLNEIAKNAIIKNFPQTKGVVNYYFKCHFDDEILDEDELVEIFGVKDFKKIDIKNVVEKLAYPDLNIWINKNNELDICPDYKVAPEYSDEILCIKMDVKLNVIKFLHES
ncbi:MAG: DUF2004 domain-containing protein [Spirochaetaceae bacterium]|jgi:hypothetical protein|nr:DUF2004 domain-containing protein [Spirochaetaceae bacterium]